MDFSPRRLPWILALVGAIHGWSAGWSSECQRFARRHPDDLLPIVLSLGFGAALFVAGWLHVHRRSRRRRDLVTAAGKILLCCGAIGVIPGLLFGIQTMLLSFSGVLCGFAVGVLALPSALLLVHAHAEREAPRAGSLLAGADRAEEALAILGALILLPWWSTDRPAEVAVILALAALPAVAIGLHAVLLAKHVRLLPAAFPSSPAVHSGNAAIVFDIGVGSEERALETSRRSAYRSSAAERTIAWRGNADGGARAALRLLGWSVAVGLAAGAQASWLLLHQKA